MDRRTTRRGVIQRTGVLKIGGVNPGATACRAVVLDQSDGGVCVSVQLPLRPQTDVVLRLDEGGYLAGLVRYCRRVADSEYQVGIAAEPTSETLERRTEARYPVALPATVTILPSGVPSAIGFHRYPAEILDISRHGVGLLCSDPITPDTSVLLELRHSEIYGIVRYCAERAFERYSLGVAVTEVLVRPRNSSGDALIAALVEQNAPPATSALGNAARSVWASALRGIHKMLPDTEVEWTGSASNPPAPRCRQYPAEGVCMLGNKWFGPYNCNVCGVLDRWRAVGVSLILAREIQDSRSLCLIPVRSAEQPPGPFIMQISFKTSTVAEVRSALQSAIESADQTWIEEPDRCIRLK